MTKIFKLTQTDDKTVERLIVDENIHYTHVILKSGDGFHRHVSDSNVYMTILRGTITLELNEQEAHSYSAGNLLNIPKGTNMLLENRHESVLEIFVVKSPAPKQ